MKKQSFKALIFAFVMLLPVSLSGCDRYTSSYNAMMLVRTNTAKSASMSFSRLEGTIVFKLKCDNADEKIHYSATLENGNAKVFYDSNGTKTELFSLGACDEINEIGGVLQKGMVYILSLKCPKRAMRENLALTLIK